MNAKKKIPVGVSFHKATGTYFGRKSLTLRDGTASRISTAYFATVGEAQDALAKAARQAVALDPAKHSVESFLEAWFAAIKPDSPNPKKPRVRERTYALRLQVLAPLLPASLAIGKRANDPAFASIRTKLLRDFTEVDLRAILSRLEANGAGSRTVQLAYEVLRAAWRYAGQRRYVDVREAPFVHVDRPEHTSKRKESLSDGEIDRLFAAIRATKVLRSRALLLMLATAGLRIGEALALRWENVDTIEGVVRVREQLTEAGEAGPLKTPESHRDVWTIPEVSDMLRELRTVAKSPYVFETVKTQRAMDRNNVRSKVFVPMIERAKLGSAGLTVHDLRGIAATVAASSGLDPVALCMMFGWTNVNTAKRFYIRQNDTMRQAAREAMMNGMQRIGHTKGSAA